jgi:hypothetical protein
MADLKNTELGAILMKAKSISTELIWRSVLNDSRFREWILDLVRQDQLFDQGIDEDGDIIGVYSEWTELINPEKVAGDPYTLNDTGDFYRSMHLIVMKDSFVIDANPIKVDDDGDVTDLFKKYGDGIVGLTNESKEKLAEEMEKRFIEEYKRLLAIN